MARGVGFEPFIVTGGFISLLVSVIYDSSIIDARKNHKKLLYVSYLTKI